MCGTSRAVGALARLEQDGVHEITAAVHALYTAGAVEHCDLGLVHLKRLKDVVAALEDTALTYRSHIESEDRRLDAEGRK